MNQNQNTPELRFGGFTEPWKQRELGQLFDYEQPGPYIVESTEYNNFYPTPVLTAGKTFILGYADESFGVKSASPDNPVIIFDDFTTASHYVDFPFKVKSSAIKLLTLKNSDDDITVASNALQMLAYIPVGHERHWISEFAGFNVFIPDSSVEQQFIGTFFRNLDSLIALQQRKYERLQHLKQALLRKMFPKPGEQVPELRFDGFTEPWEERKLGELMDITSVRRVHQKDWCNSGVRFLRARDVVAYSKGEEVDDPLYISTAMYAEYSAQCGKVQKNDLLVTGVGTIGIPWLVPNDNPVYFKDGNIIWLKNRNALDGRFLYYDFMGAQIQTFIHETTGLGTVATFTIDTACKTPIIYPSQSEQHLIGSFFRDLDNLIALYRHKYERLKRLKQALLRKMFV